MGFPLQFLGFGVAKGVVFDFSGHILLFLPPFFKNLAQKFQKLPQKLPPKTTPSTTIKLPTILPLTTTILFNYTIYIYIYIKIYFKDSLNIHLCFENFKMKI